MAEAEQHGSETGLGRIIHERLRRLFYPALALPTSGLVDILAQEPRLAGRLLVAFLGFFEQLLGHLQKALVGYEGDGVSYALRASK
jgi:hypothetical protein